MAGSERVASLGLPLYITTLPRHMRPIWPVYQPTGTLVWPVWHDLDINLPLVNQVSVLVGRDFNSDFQFFGGVDYK